MTKYYYRLKEDGTFLDYTSFEDNQKVPAFITELYIETDRKIIKLTDGSFAFEDEVNLDEEARIKAEKEFNQAKANKINELKNIRDTLEVEPIEYNGNLFDYDDKARDRIKDAQEALEGTDLTIDWTTATNTDVPLGWADFKAIRSAVAIRADVLHKRYRVCREQVDVATTIEEVEAIKWEEPIVEEPIEDVPAVPEEIVVEEEVPAEPIAETPAEPTETERDINDTR